jgi:RNA polymerase subunit RPABC4/transcription elongation factor Spt4
MRSSKSCFDCNELFTDEAAFCPFCGIQLVPNLACRNCNYVNRWTAKFCGKCGLDTLGVTIPLVKKNDILKLSEIEQDDSNGAILDITNLSYSIPQPENQITLSKCSSGVPFWPHNYIYACSEINYASKKQKEFYQYFRNAFLNEVFLDLEGNSNYAFILLFDLQNQHNIHKNIRWLEEAFSKLGKICSETIRYSRGILHETMTSTGDSEGLMRLRMQEQDEEYWRFGSKFKKKLNLKFEEVELLNKLPYPRSNFVEIEYCCIEVIKLYLATIGRLKSEYSAIGSTLEFECERIADLVARKHFRYRLNSYNYQWAIQSASSNIYSVIFKHCENAVREQFGHKRKLNTNVYDSPQAKAEIDASVVSKIEEIIKHEIKTINPPDEHTEIELNAQNTNRWKTKFHEIVANETVNGKQFVNDLIELGRLNKRNPSIENIFYEGSKFISKIDKEAALTLYIYYLHYDLRSIKFDNKKLTKTIQKSLFKTNDQLHEFERIVSDLINDRNLERAFSAVSQIYVTKRKEIKLNKDAVQEAHSKHSGTVGLLNEYLQDEFEDDQNSVVSKEINNNEVQIEITPKGPFRDEGKFSNIELNPVQTELLILFAKSSFYISQDDVESFARFNGLFRNQLIESINEACYEILDDVFIEEEDDNYIVDSDYYKRIINL